MIGVADRATLALLWLGRGAGWLSVPVGVVGAIALFTNTANRPELVGEMTTYVFETADKKRVEVRGQTYDSSAWRLRQQYPGAQYIEARKPELPPGQYVWEDYEWRRDAWRSRIADSERLVGIALIGLALWLGTKLTRWIVVGRWR